MFRMKDLDNILDNIILDNQQYSSNVRVLSKH